MEIEYKGANALTIKKNNSATVVVNPKMTEYGLKDLKVTDTIELVHESKYALDSDQKILIQGPGEYEVSDISIKAVVANKKGDPGASITIYKLELDGVRLAILGNIEPKLEETQLEQIGVVDILVIPVGGGDQTIGSHDAAKLVNQIDPKIVIPTHYADKSVKYSSEQELVEDFYKELGSGEHEIVEKLKIKNGSIPAIRSVVEIKRT